MNVISEHLRQPEVGMNDREGQEDSTPKDVSGVDRCNEVGLCYQKLLPIRCCGGVSDWMVIQEVHGQVLPTF